MAYALGWWRGDHLATKFARMTQILTDSITESTEGKIRIRINNTPNFVHFVSFVVNSFFLIWLRLWRSRLWVGFFSFTMLAHEDFVE